MIRLLTAVLLMILVFFLFIFSDITAHISPRSIQTRVNSLIEDQSILTYELMTARNTLTSLSNEVNSLRYRNEIKSFIYKPLK